MSKEVEVLTRKENLEKDFIGMGFKKLDSKLISEKPPKISWGKGFEQWDSKKQIDYLKKLASTMNHAADLIQGERNTLLKVDAKREEQIIEMRKQMAANDEMLQTQVIKMNEQRQGFNKEYAEIKQQLRVWQSSQV